MVEELEPGDQVSRFTIVRLIHHGAKSPGSRSPTFVYEAVSGTGDKVALKRCPKGGSVEREKEALITLKKDPKSGAFDHSFSHVVSLIDCYDEPADCTWLVLELGLYGLDGWLRKKHYAPSWADTLDVGHALGSALAFIHAHKLVCGDVKPANVMKFSSGWKLIDMGAAAREGEHVTEFTSSYCAPELARAFLQGKSAKALSCADVWAYGKIMYEVACGSAAALIDEEGAEEGEEGTRRVLEKVAALEGDVVDESKLRFLVLRVMLRGALRCRPPRMPLDTIMTRGFWTGNVTSSAGSAHASQNTDEDASARKQAVLELLETETEYCARLRALREGFIVPLRGGAARGECDMKVFDDVEMLLRSNEFFLRQLRARVENEGSRCVGDIMGEFARTLLRNYEEYVTHYRDANARLQENKRDSREFRNIVQKGVGANHEPIEYFLILPVQRLMRYKLLLDQIVQHTPDKESEEFGELQAALAAVNETVDAINDKQSCTAADWRGEASVPAQRRALVWTVAGAVVGLATVGLAAYGLREWTKHLKQLQLERLQVQEALQEAALHRAQAQMAIEIAAKSRAELETFGAELEKIMQEKKMLEQSSNTGYTLAGVVSAVGVASLLLFSDARLKRGATHVRTSLSGVRVYRYSYVWEPRVVWEGAMAQELLAQGGAFADAVVELGPGGLLGVDYARLDVRPRVCGVRRGARC